MLSCFKLDCVKPGAVLSCVFLTMGNHRIRQHLVWKIVDWLQMIGNTASRIYIILDTRQIHSICVCVESLDGQRE